MYQSLSSHSISKKSKLVKIILRYTNALKLGVLRYVEGGFTWSVPQVRATVDADPVFVKIPILAEIWDKFYA